MKTEFDTDDANQDACARRIAGSEVDWELTDPVHSAGHEKAEAAKALTLYYLRKKSLFAAPTTQTWTSCQLPAISFFCQKVYQRQAGKTLG